ncbi:hypothetical protein DFH08DRAFT_811438 [Mycena albidolilacea]|uniref:Uncharacterized protein n=1 Tax=Mycena albidolilacea TaxID=1033008 RepID=A0AAD6ZVB1_9AGAR|nr:hypothetical protein DFH08DRAFT_811438 [Mycena albidolilacea]
MTPKLCSAETMLWFYLKLKPSGTKTSILSITFLSHSDSSSSVFPPRPVLVLFQLGVKPNHFRRSQVKLDLAPSLILDTTKVPVHSATTSPNPDSRSARPIQVHFNNFHLQLNYSGFKLNVPGTRLITSQVMLNYHTSQCFLALLDSFSCFTEPQARVYYFRFLESSQSSLLIYILKTTFIRLKDRSYGTITQRLSHTTGTYAHSETPLTSNSHPVSSRHKLGRPNSLPPDFTYGLHTETYFISSMSTTVEEFLYFYRRFHACLSYRLEGNAQAREFIFDDKSTTVHLPERRRIILTQRPQSSNGCLDNIGPFFLGETPP